MLRNYSSLVATFLAHVFTQILKIDLLVMTPSNNLHVYVCCGWGNHAVSRIGHSGSFSFLREEHILRITA